MILGALILISFLGFFILVYLKVKNLVHKGSKTPILNVFLELALAFILLLALFVVQFVTAYSAAQNDIYLPDAYEASVYLQFGSYFIPILTVLSFLEILAGMGILASRGRMKSASE